MGRPRSLGSSGGSSYEGYSRHQPSPQGTSQPPRENAGSTYKPQSSHPSNALHSRGPSYSYQGDSRDRDRERENRDRERESGSWDQRYPQRRDYHTHNNYQPRNTYFPRDQYDRNAGGIAYSGRYGRGEYAPYNTRDDNRPRDRPQMNQRYGSNPRSLSSTGSSTSATGYPHSQVRRAGTTGDYHHRPEPSHEPHRPQSSRPSLIPKDFKDDDDEEEDLILGRKGSPHSAHRNEEPLPETVVKVETSKSDGLADKLPLTLEHKEELDSSLSKKSSSLSLSDSNRDKQTDISAETTLESSTDVKPQVLEVPLREDEITTERPDVEMDDGDDSDDYDPEVDQEKIERELNIINYEVPSSDQPSNLILKDEKDTAAKVVLKLEEDAEMSKAPQSGGTTKAVDQVMENSHITSSIPQPLPSRFISPLSEPEYCCFPLPETEQRVWELKNHTKEEKLRRLPFLLKTPVTDFSEYSFYQRNFLVFKQGVFPKLKESLSIIKLTSYNHKLALVNEYSHRQTDHNQRKEIMEDQATRLYPTPPADATVADDREPESPAESRRRSRHADTVNSEAEFQEILEKFEKEKFEKDPLYRAEQLAATIPDMLQNPIEMKQRMLEKNNIVLDKLAWAQRIKTDPIDTFTQREHELFCEAYLIYPKKFGRISNALGGTRTPEECVLHYYKTKKTVTDYKKLLATKKKKSKKGVGRGRRPKGKSSSAANTPITNTPVESGSELNLEDFVPSEPSEELFTETGRRRRNAAPVFDSEKKLTPETDSESSQTKRTLDTQPSDAIADEHKKVKKKQRGPKPKKGEITPSIGEVTSEGDTKSKHAISSYWSVRDISLFTKLYAEVGSNWSYIASELGTKSATMVRNFHARNADRVNESRAKTPDVDAVRDVSEKVIDIQQRNPPLGFFSAPTNVPSNLTFVKPPRSEGAPSLPPLTNDTSNILPMAHGYINRFEAPSSIGRAHQPLPHLSHLPSLPSVPPPTNGPHFPMSTTGGESRSSAFSITNLLNPPEDRRPPPNFPVSGRFSPVPQMTEIYNGQTNAPSQQPSPPVSSTTSTATQPAAHEIHEVKPHAQAQSEAQLQHAFNPLDALVAAVENDGGEGNSTIIEEAPRPNLPGLSETMGASLHNMSNS